MRIARGRTKLILGFIIVTAAFIALRVNTLNHLLMYDEARNIISLRAYLSNNTADPFYRNYFLHPPLYMTFAGLLAPFKAGLDLRLELLSLFFSYLTLSAVYALSARLGGWKYALFSGLFLCLMPVSIAYDTWIKRDCLAIAAGYLAILLLYKRKYLWCAFALSFSMLAKENALFFILAATAILFALRESGIPKKLAVIYGTIFISASWWYIFFSSMPAQGYDIYFSSENNAASWGNGPLYYCGKLLTDMGLPLLILFVTGAGYIAHLVFRKKQYRWSLPLVTVLCVYIPISLVMASKTPWLSLSAAPALAMVAGSGALFLSRAAARSKICSAVLWLILAISIFGGLSFSYAGYHVATYPNGWAGAGQSRELALCLNRVSKSSQRLMLTQFSYWGMPPCIMCPIFLYYLEARPICAVDGRDSPGEVIKGAVDNKISWLAVIDSADKQYNFHALATGLEGTSLGKPIRAGYSRIWKTDDLWRRTAGGSDIRI